jgi:hypothetical protein
VRAAGRPGAPPWRVVARQRGQLAPYGASVRTREQTILGERAIPRLDGVQSPAIRRDKLSVDRWRWARFPIRVYARQEPGKRPAKSRRGASHRTLPAHPVGSICLAEVCSARSEPSPNTRSPLLILVCAQLIAAGETATRESFNRRIRTAGWDANHCATRWSGVCHLSCGIAGRWAPRDRTRLGRLGSLPQASPGVGRCLRPSQAGAG